MIYAAFCLTWFCMLFYLSDVPMMKMEWLQSDDEWSDEFRSKMNIAKAIFREGILHHFKCSTDHLLSSQKPLELQLHHQTPSSRHKT